MRVTSEDILNGPIGRTLVRMAVPMSLGTLTLILFHAVDTYFVSLLGTTELAAISFTFPVSFTLSSFCAGLSVATSVILAKIIGEGDYGKAQRITTDSLLLCTVVVLVIAFVGLKTIDPLFSLLGATSNTLPLIHEYMDIWYLAAGVLVILIVSNGVIRATGDTKWTSIVLIAAGFLNAILDPVFIFGFGPVPAMGMKGAAIATVIAWSCSVMISAWILLIRDKLLVFNKLVLAELWEFGIRLFKIGLPIAAANMLIPVGSAVLTAIIANYGEQAVAAFGAGSRIEAVALVVCLGLSNSLIPYMAQNLGAKNYERAWTSLKISLRFILLFQFCLYPLLVLIAPWLARIFSNDPAVIEVTKQFLWIMPIGFAFYGSVTIMNTAFNAAHQSHKTLLSSLFRVFCCYAPGAWIGSQLFDIPGMFTGAVIGNGIATLIIWRMLNDTYGRIAREHRDTVGPDDFDLSSVDEVELKSVQVD